MNLFGLTRALIDIESISGSEKQVGLFLFDCLSELAARHQGCVERMEVEPDRFNLFAQWGDPIVTLSSHMDTVPPFIPFREDAEYIWGRGACDAKGIIGSMIAAADAEFRAPLRCGRRTKQRRSDGGRQGASGLAVPDQRRTHGEQVGHWIERRAAV